jgi:hypothetical protein
MGTRQGWIVLKVMKITAIRATLPDEWMVAEVTNHLETVARTR